MRGVSNLALRLKGISGFGTRCHGELCDRHYFGWGSHSPRPHVELRALRAPPENGAPGGLAAGGTAAGRCLRAAEDGAPRRLSRCRPPEGAAAPARPRLLPALAPGAAGPRRGGRREGEEGGPAAAPPPAGGRWAALLRQRLPRSSAPRPAAGRPWPRCLGSAAAAAGSCSLPAPTSYFFSRRSVLGVSGRGPGRDAMARGREQTLGPSAEALGVEGAGQSWKAGGGRRRRVLTPLSRPVREGGLGGWRCPLKFVSELGWSADGAARAPLSGPGSEVTVPAGAETGSRPAGPAAVCGTGGWPAAPGRCGAGESPGRGKRSSRGPPLGSGKSSLKG